MSISVVVPDKQQKVENFHLTWISLPFHVKSVISEIIHTSKCTVQSREYASKYLLLPMYLYLLFSFYRSPCISSGLCYLSVLLLALLASVLAGKLDLYEKNCVLTTVQPRLDLELDRGIFQATLGANGLGDGQWGFPDGPVEGRQLGKSKNFVPLVLTLYHAFRVSFASKLTKSSFALRPTSN